MKNWLRDLNIKVVILSRGRSDSIITHKKVPDFIPVLCPESEKELYEKAVSNPILTTPDDVIGMGCLRNWCLDNFKEETVLMLDDDIKRCACLTGYRTRMCDPIETMQVLINCAIMAKDAGCKVFGFSQTDIRKFNATEPFKLSSWVSAIIGVIGRDFRFRNDKLKVDIDFCLQNLMVNRILWQDARYDFYQLRDNNKGGNAKFRTQKDYEESTRTLKQRWGKYINIKWAHKNQLSISMNVQRKQQIVI